MKHKHWILMLAAILAGLVIWWSLKRSGPRLMDFGPEVSDGVAFSNDDYAAVLKTHVDNRGMVSYKELMARRQELDRFAATLAHLDPAVYERWDQKEQIAFWINAYNALTLEAIINHYPIEPSLLKSVVFPKNSIRQIPGVWDELQFIVMRQKVTLNEIEHEILRGQFNEPRIHLALVCAAKGCPSLRNEPFRGDRLDEQFDDQARRFFSDPSKFRIDRRAGRIYLSPIFDWFGEDFVKNYGTKQEFSGHSTEERAVLNFISLHLAAEDRRYLTDETYEIEYLTYDWSLNEQEGSKRIS